MIKIYIGSILFRLGGAGRVFWSSFLSGVLKDELVGWRSRRVV